MKTGKELMITFRDYAKSKGYTKKLIGDYAFYNKTGNIIRFVSAKKGIILVWEQDIGRYEI